MKHLISFLLLFLLPTFIRAQIYQEVKIHAAPESIRTIAGLGIAVDDGIYRNGIWQTMLSTEDVAKVRNAGFTIDIIREDYSKYIAERNQAAEQDVKEINSQIRTKSIQTTQYPVPQHFELGTMGGYYSPDEVLNELDSMYLLYPNLIIQKTQLTPRLTVEGRIQYYTRISNTPTQNTNKPKIVYNALTHAREPMGMQQLMYFMWYLLENYSTNAEVKYLVDNLELYFIPVVNPDGYAYNYFTYPGGGGMWRKNRKDNGGGVYGVDLNRNFGYMWAYDDYGSSPNPGDETYRGPMAFSENESQNIRDFFMAQKFKMAYNYHTYADQTLYPWCYQTRMTSDSLTEMDFTDHMMAQNGYVTGPPGAILYNTNGDIMDWEYGDVASKPRIICFTTETGNSNDGFWPLPYRIIPLAQENMYANLQAAHLTLPYAEVMDMGPVINPMRDAYFHFEFKRIGLTDSADYTITVKPLDSLLFASVGPAKVIHFPEKQIIFRDSIAYSLLQGIQIGQTYRFIWQINNGLTILSDTVTKYYGWPRVLLMDSCNTMENWTSPKWNISTRTSHSAPSSIADSPTGPYNNNTNYSVTLTNSIPIGQSPVAVVEFWVRYGIEKSMDFCELYTSMNNGVNFVSQATRYTNNGSIAQDFPNPIYDGYRNWSQDRIVLPAAANSEFLAKFRIHSDGDAVIKDGMYFDDFKVSVVDMNYNGIDLKGTFLGFISAPIPNPASNHVTFDYQLPGNNSSSGSFQLFDTRGIVVKEVPVVAASGNIRFSVESLPAGIYLYRICGNFGSTAVRKLVVAH